MTNVTLAFKTRNQVLGTAFERDVYHTAYRCGTRLHASLLIHVE